MRTPLARRKTSEFGTNWHEFYHPVKGPLSAPKIRVLAYGPSHLDLRDEIPNEYGPQAFTLANPGLFATGATSAPEGWFYWGCIQELGEHGEESGWQYQRKVRPGGAKIGAATVDFVFESSPRPIACRILTPWFHRLNPDQEVDDQQQADMLNEQGYDVVDAPSELYMGDPEGWAVRKMVRRVVSKDPMLMPGSGTYIAGG